MEKYFGMDLRPVPGRRPQVTGCDRTFTVPVDALVRAGPERELDIQDRFNTFYRRHRAAVQPGKMKREGRWQLPTT